MTTRREVLRAGVTVAAGAAMGRSAGAQSEADRTLSTRAERVRSGLEALARNRFRELAHGRIGLVTNPTGILPDLRSGIDALFHAPGVKLRALFGPEHGVRGDAPAGEAVTDSRDTATGLPAYSLYGKTRVPTAEMLRGLDALVFDLQDIGSRSYTYISTLGCVLEGAARHNIPVVVLDRPNPIGLSRVEGGPVREGFASFISKYPIAFRHGMTLGELAKMIPGEGWLPAGLKADLKVIPCENLTRALPTWQSFGGLPWAPTSPHIPHAESAAFYAVTGIVGELSALSIGVGYTLPFEMAGAPDVPPEGFTRDLTERSLPGFAFRATTWTPFYGDLKGKSCGGAQIYLNDPATATLTRPNFDILDALRRAAPKLPFFADADATRLFDWECGTDAVRHAFSKGADAGEMWRIFDTGRDRFETQRRKYLIYP